MNEEEVKQILKLMGERFVGTKAEHRAVDVVVKSLCESLKIHPPVEAAKEEKVE